MRQIMSWFLGNAYKNVITLDNFTYVETGELTYSSRSILTVCCNSPSNRSASAHLFYQQLRFRPCNCTKVLREHEMQTKSDRSNQNKIKSRH